MAKALISFLGTSNYLKANYCHPSDDELRCETIYIQEALIRFFMMPLSSEDKVIICLTESAKAANWEPENRIGLKNILEGIKNECGCNYEIHDVDIPDITDEKDVWLIFNKLKDNIPEKSEIIFDITHSFRSLPLLGIVLINYLRIVKDIKLEGIYYGAFEKLGQVNKVLDIDEKQRYVPVIELTTLDYIMRFSYAASDFINYGVSNSLKSILLEKAIPLLKNSKGRDLYAKAVRDFISRLERVTNSIATNRGREIYHGRIFHDLINSIENIKKEFFFGSSFDALLPLFDKIENKISRFDKDNILNGLHAVKWCLDHNLIQQGITILHETILSAICSLAEIDFLEREWREFASSALHCISRSDKFESLNIKEINPDAALVKWKKLNEAEFKEYIKIYNSLREYRNYINHAGMSYEDNREPDDFIKKLSTAAEQFYGLVFK